MNVKIGGNRPDIRPTQLISVSASGVPGAEPTVGAISPYLPDTGTASPPMRNGRPARMLTLPQASPRHDMKPAGRQVILAICTRLQQRHVFHVYGPKSYPEHWVCCLSFTEAGSNVRTALSLASSCIALRPSFGLRPSAGVCADVTVTSSRSRVGCICGPAIR